MAVPTRLNTITYAGFAVGGSDTTRQIHEAEIFEGEHGRFSVSFTVVLSNSNRATFRAACTALEAAYSKIEGDLSVVFDSVDVIDVTHADNTGYNARASWTALDSHRTANSQAYRCTVTVELPEDATGRNGRRESTYTVTYDPGLFRTLTVEAVYTAQPGGTPKSASEQAEDQFGTFSTAIQSAVGGTWEQVSYVPTVLDDQDKLAKVTAVYREVIHRQSLSATNDPDFIQPQLQVRNQVVSSELLTSSGAIPEAFVVVDFSTQVVKTTTDLKGLISSKVIPLLKAEAEAYMVTSGALIPVESTLVADPHRNTIQGSVAFSSTTGTLLFADMTTKDTGQTGRLLVPVLDGNPLSGDLHLVPGSLVRVIQLETSEIDVGQSVFQPHELMVRAQAASGTNWHLISWDYTGRRTERELELLNGGSRRVVGRTSVHVLEYREVSSGNGGTRTRDQDRLGVGEI